LLEQKKRDTNFEICIDHTDTARTIWLSFHNEQLKLHAIVRYLDDIPLGETREIPKSLLESTEKRISDAASGVTGVVTSYLHSLGITQFEKQCALSLKFDELPLGQPGALYADGIAFTDLEAFHHLSRLGNLASGVVAVIRTGPVTPIVASARSLHLR
jgi:hypothetical protein